MMGMYFPQLHYMVIFAIGLGGITYYSAAQERGWAVGRLMSDPSSSPMVVAFVSVISAILLTIFKIGWLELLITAVGGYALMVILLSVLKSAFQLLLFTLYILTPLAIVWGITS